MLAGTHTARNEAAIPHTPDAAATGQECLPGLSAAPTGPAPIASDPVRFGPFWFGTVAAFLHASVTDITGTLALAQIRHFRLNEAQQLRAWEATIAMLRPALAACPAATSWHIALEFPLLRLGRRPDVILLTATAILVLEVKAGARAYLPADRRQVEDYAIDLHDFHAGSRSHPIIPILLAEHAPPPVTPLPLVLGHGVTPTVDTNATSLPALLQTLSGRRSSGPDLEPEAWLRAAYHPVPTIIDAACMLYAKHGVDEIRAARSDASNLQATTAAILHAVAQARANDHRLILFVTGIPGAGKTLCGLNAVFGVEAEGGGTYLTGNPTLVHVLREALTRDATRFGAKRGDASRKMQSVIQALPRFRDHYVSRPGEPPPERVVVIDEAQRCWSAEWAVPKTRDKPIPLSRSEPAHLLEIMARHSGYCAVICLVGSGQEIHRGEGGLAEWGTALREAAASGNAWQVRAAPDLLRPTDKRHALGPLPSLLTIDSLHLQIPLRQIRSTQAASWVDHVLAGDLPAASALARADPHLPFRLTRDPAAMRDRLRGEARGLRRAGLLASSGARRLRAEGFGTELAHMDQSAVAHWFLDRFPEDVRASDALEMLATEFSCQGLELDYVGLCWDSDLIREPAQRAWRVRSFIGTKWQLSRQAETIANQMNTYRVLLTRARYETVIFVPRGCADDPTRAPHIYDAIADFLEACGARPLTPEPTATTMLAPLLI